MLISVADFLESCIECMLTQLLSLLKVEGGGLRLDELMVAEFCSTCPPPMTSSFSAVAWGGAEDTAAMAGVTVVGA